MIVVVYDVCFFSFSSLLFHMDVSVLLSFSVYQKTLWPYSGQFFVSVTTVLLYLDLLDKHIFLPICGIHKGSQIQHRQTFFSKERNTWRRWSLATMKEFFPAWVTQNCLWTTNHVLYLQNFPIILFRFEWKLHKIWHFFGFHVRNRCCRNDARRKLYWYVQSYWNCRRKFTSVL